VKSNALTVFDGGTTVPVTSKLSKNMIAPDLCGFMALKQNDAVTGDKNSFAGRNLLIRW